MKKRFIIINPKDNVGVVLVDVNKNDIVYCENYKLVARDNIKFAHKIALKDIRQREDIIKYGESIGYALVNISKGDWVHIHNMDCERAREGTLV